MESKSFDLIKEAGTNGLCVIEHGKNYMRNILLGSEGDMVQVYDRRSRVSPSIPALSKDFP